MEHATLSDVLDAARISWRYYSTRANSIWEAMQAIQHICQPGAAKNGLECLGPARRNGNVTDTQPSQVLTDVANCTLASVSWVTPPAWSRTTRATTKA